MPGGRPEVPIDIKVVKKLLYLRKMDGMTMQTIADIVGVSIRTLERRLNKWRDEGLL